LSMGGDSPEPAPYVDNTVSYAIVD